MLKLESKFSAFLKATQPKYGPIVRMPNENGRKTTMPTSYLQRETIKRKNETPSLTIVAGNQGLDSEILKGSRLKTIHEKNYLLIDGLICKCYGSSDSFRQKLRPDR